MAVKRATIKEKAHPAIVIGRSAIVSEKLVYVAVANRHIKYQNGRSKIVYFGTTKNGSHRIAQSASYRAREMLANHGLKSLAFYVITSTPRPGVKMWTKLESALILAFKDKFGEPPKCNKVGKNKKWGDELNYFARNRLDALVDKYSNLNWL